MEFSMINKKHDLMDEEKDATKRGAQLLRDFSHPEIYQLLEKYFPKQ